MTTTDKKTIIVSIWKEIKSDFLHVDKDLWHKKTTKLRELFEKAFEHFIEDIQLDNYEEQYDALTIWAAQLHAYPYKSLHPCELDFYNRIFAITNASYPQVTNRWLTPKKLEEEYGFSINWQGKARMASSDSNLPFHKMGKFIRYDREEIDAWIKEHKVR